MSEAGKTCWHCEKPLVRRKRTTDFSWSQQRFCDEVCARRYARQYGAGDVNHGHNPTPEEIQQRAVEVLANRSLVAG